MALQKSQQSQSRLKSPNTIVSINILSWQYFIPGQHPLKIHLPDIHKVSNYWL